MEAKTEKAPQVTLQGVEGTFGAKFTVLVDGLVVGEVRRRHLLEALGIEKAPSAKPADDQPFTWGDYRRMRDAEAAPAIAMFRAFQEA